MKRFFKSRHLLFLSWSFPPPLIALIVGLAILNGVDHSTLKVIHVTALALSLLIVLYLSGLSLSLYEKALVKERELDQATESFRANSLQIKLLKETTEKLTGMREIQMSSHIESFSAHLRNILSITHGTTDAHALTIYLECGGDLGAFPKASMFWIPEDDRLSGEVSIFFKEEIPLGDQDDGYFSGFGLDHIHSDPTELSHELRGVCLVDNKPVGDISYLRPDASLVNLEKDGELLKEWMENFKINTAGVYQCWQSQSLFLKEFKDYAAISVPILSEGLVIGVLAAEFLPSPDGESMHDHLVNARDLLLDYGRSIGQRLKKEKLYEQAIKDGLTGLYNKAHYETQLNEHFHRMLRYGRDLSYIFIDIDFFKKINDTYGHLTGDLALKNISLIIQENIRKSDVAFRIGGEELAVLLIETPLEDAVAVAEKLREIIQNTEFPRESGGVIRFTSSFGVSCIKPGMKTPQQLVAAADRALYKAKDGGRNRVVTSD